MKVEKKKFDDLLGKLLSHDPAKQEDVEAGESKKPIIPPFPTSPKSTRDK